MNLFVGQVERFSAFAGDDRGFQADSAARTLGRNFVDRAFDAAEDDLSGRAALAAGRFVEAAVQGDRDVEGRANGVLLHGNESSLAT